MIGYVYKITNTINGKSYVGQHKYEGYPEIDPSYFGSGKLLKLAIDKYGIENFSIEVLKWCEDYDEMNNEELSLTFEHHAFVSQGGYVLRAGDKKAIFSDEYRRNLSEAHKGYIMPQEQKDKISVDHIGKRYALGFKHPQEYIEANRKRMLLWWQNIPDEVLEDRAEKLKIAAENDWLYRYKDIKYIDLKKVGTVDERWKLLLSQSGTQVEMKNGQPRTRFSIKKTSYINSGICARLKFSRNRTDFILDKQKKKE